MKNPFNQPVSDSVPVAKNLMVFGNATVYTENIKVFGKATNHTENIEVFGEAKRAN